MLGLLFRPVVRVWTAGERGERESTGYGDFLGL
jgi:hypothetical protein